MTPKLSKEQIAKIRRQRIEAAQQHDGYEFEDDWKDLDEQAGAQPPPGHPEDQPDVYPPPSAPFEVAQQLYGQYRKDGARLGNGRRKDGVRTLLAWRGGWMLWRGTHWAEIDTAELRSYIYTTLDKAVYEKATKSGIELVPWEPSRRKIGDVLEAMAAVGHLAKDIDPPSWVVHITAESPPGQMISCANGLLDLSKRQLTDHTPALFNHVHVPFDYDSDAGDPAIWLDFLASVWDDDHDSIALLQQYFGYILSGRLEQQKLMMLVGPTRSGKGTIARTLMALIGPRNVANPTMASLSTNFGLMPLIGKPLAIVSDARLGNTPADAVVERLLSITGEDSLTIDRKYQSHWTGKLSSRFLLLSNELPQFQDASGVVANRFLILKMTESFLGREDYKLPDKLRPELPAILNWALEGLDSLNRAGTFTVPQSSRDAVVLMQDLASPVAAFTRERCVREPSATITRDKLYAAWKSWAEDNGHKPKSKITFGRDLRAVVPELGSSQQTIDGERTHCYVGIELK